MLFLLFACDQPTLQPVVEAGAAAIAEDAAPALALALGGAGLVSGVCANTQSDWRGLAGTTLSLTPEHADLLGRSDAGQVRYDDSSGLAEVLWSEDADGEQMRLVVDRPQSSFILRFQVASDTGAPSAAAELRYTADGCREAPVIGVSGSVDAPWVAASLGNEAPLGYASPGALAPSSGVLTWQDAELRGRQLLTDDAENLSDWSWPGQAKQADWTWPVTLVLIAQ